MTTAALRTVEAAASRSAHRLDDLSFEINGRFLTQTQTGVQRYAREVTEAIDQILSQGRHRVRLVVPAAAQTAELPLKAVSMTSAGHGRGHVWEQTSLPRTRGACLLNLCNVAPVAHRNNIVCIHDINVVDAPYSYSLRFRLLYRGLQPLIARGAARLASVSAYSASRLAAHFGVPLKTIRILPNGHEHVRRWDASRATVGLDEAARPYVLVLGSRAKHKNIARVVGLADKLDALNLDVLIAGGDAASFASTPLASRTNVRVLGRVTDDDLALLFSRALCLAFPSLAEGFGLPVLEAMALGCPVIASNRTSLPEICGAAALAADPDDDHAWLAHFRRLAASRDLWSELRGRGLVQASAYTWSRTADGYLDLARELQP